MNEIDEILKIAVELKNYARTMQNDPYRRRWELASLAMVSLANSMAVDVVVAAEVQ